MEKGGRDNPLRIGILGFGREGKSVFGYLKKSSQFKKSKIEILDRKSGKDYLKGLARFNVIFRSPGVPYNLPELKKAREDGVYFSSVTRLFFENYGGKVIGVTGTKGKGTTSTLIYKILKATGEKVFLAGNIGKSAIEALSRNKSAPAAVLELSSFQLQDLDLSPAIAVMLDIFPDHQDAHKNLTEYYEAKANIGRFQKKSDKIFYFNDNAMSKKLAEKSPARKFPVDYRKFKEFKRGDLLIKGSHNFRNAVMAATVARRLGADWGAIKRVVKSYRGLEHRLEFVRAIRGTTWTRRGQTPRYFEVSFYDDSASTNPMTSAAALEAFGKEKKILIAGGQDKNLDYSPLRSALKKYGTEAVILFGENKNKIRAAIGGMAKVRFVKNLAEAVKIAYDLAKDSDAHTSPLNKDGRRIYTNHKNRKEAAVIFSPGAASFDMFKDYADRGKKFKNLVLRLTGCINKI